MTSPTVAPIPAARVIEMCEAQIEKLEAFRRFAVEDAKRLEAVRPPTASVFDDPTRYVDFAEWEYFSKEARARIGRIDEWMLGLQSIRAGAPGAPAEVSVSPTDYDRMASELADQTEYYDCYIVLKNRVKPR